MITIYFFNMKEMLFSEIPPVTASLKKSHASRIGKEIVKKAAAERFSCDEKKLVFSFTEKGKPYIEALPDFHFNITHSGDIVAVAAAESEIGFDAERIRSVSLAVAERFFTESENGYIQSSPCPEASFFEIWTAKEAYLKRKGAGIGKNLNAFSVTSPEIKNETVTFKRGGYCFSVCCKNISALKLVDITDSMLCI